jgi:hypothetical protein
MPRRSRLTQVKIEQGARTRRELIYLILHALPAD